MQEYGVWSKLLLASLVISVPCNKIFFVICVFGFFFHLKIFAQNILAFSWRRNENATTMIKGLTHPRLWTAFHGLDLVAGCTWHFKEESVSTSSAKTPPKMGPAKTRPSTPRSWTSSTRSAARRSWTGAPWASLYTQVWGVWKSTSLWPLNLINWDISNCSFP